jgi:UDP-2,3-diacylglucosamine pyrophosphatase LpxH
MTKIAYCSDLHLEFGIPFKTELPTADVLILAGDILLARDLENDFPRFESEKVSNQFLHDISKKYNQIIWIPGNHEFYQNTLARTNHDIWNTISRERFSISFNEYGIQYVNDIKIIYGTLWTDINKGNPIDNFSGDVINDYTNIWTQTALLTQEDTKNMHEIQKNHFKKEIKDYFGKIVCVSHHAPSTIMLSESNELDYYYACTDMDDIILDNTDKIKFWISGHTHENKEVQMGNTKLVSNCKEYPGHNTNFEIKVLTI